MHNPGRRAVVAGLGAGLACSAGLAQLPAAKSAGITRLDPRLDRIIPPTARIEVLAGGYTWSEGPLWVPQGDYLLFSDVPKNVVHRWDRTNGAKPFLSPSGFQGVVPATIREPGANGLALDRQGRLLLADSGSRALVRVDLATRRRTVLADRFEGKRFNSPNDLVVTRSGAIYFTDPTYGLEGMDESPVRELDFAGLYRLDPDGTLTVLDRTQRKPNGVGLSPDERTLYLALSDRDRPHILAYALDARGMQEGVRVFRDMRREQDAGLPGAPDGMDVAPNGHLFASGPGGIHILSPDGELLGIIGTGKPIANACVGEGGNSLFITASDQLCRVPLRTGA
ncbi:SMP-30/gluconolactonase/LRE family protein [Sphingomonas sp.]|uniref:SMP-30/gluconolactonase/LRE family protein n=1 Tax=Sphingomonas sp. TaxID=28214 RepID=UPI002EDB5CD1